MHRALTPIGLQYVYFGALLRDSPVLGEDSGITLKLNIYRDGDYISSSTRGPKVNVSSPDYNAHWHTFVIDEPGPYSAFGEVWCEGRLIVRHELPGAYDAKPILVADRHIPRFCWRLDPLSDHGDGENELFDCDGVVIDANGVPQFRPSGEDVFVIHTDGGVLRWLRDNSSVRADFGGNPFINAGASNPVEFPQRGHGSSWAAAEDFAVSENAVAVFDSGVLKRYELDAGEFGERYERREDLTLPLYEMVAAVSRDGRRVVAMRRADLLVWWDADYYYFPIEPLYICEIIIDGESAGLSNCFETAGEVIRQERLERNKLLIQRYRDVFWLDLLEETEHYAFTLRDHQQPERAGIADGLQANFWRVGYGHDGHITRAGTLNIIVPVLPSWNRYDQYPPYPTYKEETLNGAYPIFRFAHRASSDFVWGSDRDNPGAGTYWAPLP